MIAKLKENNKLMLTADERAFLQKTCLVDEQAEELTRKILSTPNDVSHEFYKKIFEGFDWRAYEQRKETKSDLPDNSDSGS